MVNWKVNLSVLWIGQFLAMAGMTMIMPFLPLYLQELGVTDTKQVAYWSGIIFAGNFVTSFIAQPIWGGLADRYGRKVMLLRSGFGMALVMTFMGFATDAWHLLLLRLVNGTVSGFVPASVALMSTNTPRNKIGFAMGTLQSGGVAGTILGPLIGGILAELIGFRSIFYLTGGLLFVASLLAMFLVKESFNASEARSQPRVSLWQSFKDLAHIPQLPALFAVTFMFQFALMSPQPLMALFVQDLYGKAAYLAFFAGLVGSVNGFSNMIASPVLGRFGDKLGSEKILGICLIGSALAFIPQALVSNIWQLLAARFFMGIFMGGMLPSIYALIRKYTPEGMESRSYSFNSSTLSLGNVIGPLTGGVLNGFIGIRGIFWVSSALLLLNFFWVRRTLLSSRWGNRLPGE
ncbi:MFS transporter [Paenibacillus aurantius]|uniref:MFS transporter n=1 Tax=Paenibacillus aurantius TaxID=2918900 RepID=A0AA96LCV7_9BACL|nr:MFS transporter [Paenibacillus aurantius]WNQ09781.1 MFS transporter [Paenibacillus aurantius]